MGSGQLPGFFGDLAPVLNQYGYLAVAALVLLEDFGVPVPGETILIAGAVYAGTGRLNVILLGIVALAAAVAGDNIGFAIGHFGGRPLVLKWGKYVLITESRLNRAERFFEHHGGKIVTVARFVEGLRQVNGIIAGISKMRWPKFIAYNVLGAGLWCAVWITVGYVAGNRIDVVYQKFKHYEIYIAIAVGVLVLAYIAREIYKHRKDSRSAG